jgi:hypothetical protein
VGIRLLHDDSSIPSFWGDDPSCNAEHNLRGDCWLDLRGLDCCALVISKHTSKMYSLDRDTTFDSRGRMDCDHAGSD